MPADPSQPVRIGIVAPACRLDEAVAARVRDLAAAEHGAQVALVFHPQCFLQQGHFAGSDAARAAAFMDVVNDPGFDAVWFARGGYGSFRILEQALGRIDMAEARRKMFLGYSDLGSLLGALYSRGLGVAHGPMPADIARSGGEVAVRRALDFLVGRNPGACEVSLVPGQRYVAFNLTILSRLIGTSHFPDLDGHVVLLEDVSEYMYNIDRMMAHLVSYPPFRRVAGVRLGRCSQIPPNDPDFGQDEAEVVSHWCRTAGIAYLGRADIGHDVENKVVPFGRFTPVRALSS